MALGHVIVLLQQEWPRGENLFLKAISKICQQGNFQYENFFSYVTSILPLDTVASECLAQGHHTLGSLQLLLFVGKGGGVRIRNGAVAVAL